MRVFKGKGPPSSSESSNSKKSLPSDPKSVNEPEGDKPMSQQGLLPPTYPYQGTRGLDDEGGGGFNAPRRKTIAGDTIFYGHKGLDFVAKPGTRIIMPASGYITHLGVAYTRGDMGSIHIKVDEGEQVANHPSHDYTIKILYAKPIPKVKIGTHLNRGELLAHAQDIAGFHDKPNMTPHIHMEVYRDGRLLNPANVMELT
jgi:murein DD-endopeptidase MepM/ murein hydrolase activator NlpD